MLNIFTEIYFNSTFNGLKIISCYLPYLRKIAILRTSVQVSMLIYTNKHHNSHLRQKNEQSFHCFHFERLFFFLALSLRNFGVTVDGVYNFWVEFLSVYSLGYDYVHLSVRFSIRFVVWLCYS